MSASTSTPLNGTPRPVSTLTTAAEKPHCGAAGIPFMNSTTSLSAMVAWMRSVVELVMGFPLVVDRIGRCRNESGYFGTMVSSASACSAPPICPFSAA